HACVVREQHELYDDPPPALPGRLTGRRASTKQQPREGQRQVHLQLMGAQRSHPALGHEVDAGLAVGPGRSALAGAAIALIAALALASPSWFSPPDTAAPPAGAAHARAPVRALPAG